MNKVTDWFPNGFKSYYDSQYKRGVSGTFKVQRSIIEMNRTAQGVYVLDQIAEHIAQKAIDIIVTLKYTLLRNAKFSWLLEQDRDQLREAVCAIAEHWGLNKNVWQRVNASSLSLGSVSINSDITGWLLSKDALGISGWSVLNNTGIDEYEIVSEDDLDFFIQTHNGNIQVLGSFDKTSIPVLL